MKEALRRYYVFLGVGSTHFTKAFECVDSLRQLPYRMINTKYKQLPFACFICCNLGTRMQNAAKLKLHLLL